MKRITCTAFLCLLSAVLGLSAQTFYYVSPNGNDGNEGTLQSPFQSIVKAQLEARKTQGETIIFLREGKYRLSEPLVFTADDGKVRERRNPMSLIGFVKGEDGFVGIVKGLKNEFSSFVEVNEGNYSVGLIFHIEGIEFDPYEDLVIDFHNLKGSDANYSEMGKIYRKYQQKLRAQLLCRGIQRTQRPAFRVL